MAHSICKDTFALAMTLISLAVTAQDYPARPVRIVVPYPPGGGVDILARPIADRLGRLWGTPVVVENKAGAGTLLGAEFVARAIPDGYTLLLTSDTTITSNPYVYKKLPYDPVKDFAPLTRLVALPQMVLAHPSLGANSLPELVVMAKAKPGSLNYGSYGNGSQPHLVYSNLEALSGARITHIPYKGSAPAIAALIANEVQVSMGSGNHHGMIRAGKLKALAIARGERDPQFPNVPTLREAGFPELDPQLWFGILSTAGTPRPVIDKIVAGIGSIFADPQFREPQVTSKSYDVAISSPEEFAAFIRADLEYKARMIKRAGIQPE
ncbi:MAG: tripartite tricarboxylate transporter substrate binding protein [Betaproteobacteria bacterium]|nr:tripartite tricarboxylate transporter substrate binding protein [Betaproteobacteria bacterium]